MSRILRFQKDFQPTAQFKREREVVLIWEKPTITFMKRFDCLGFSGSKRIFNQRHNSREIDLGEALQEHLWKDLIVPDSSVPKGFSTNGTIQERERGFDLGEAYSYVYEEI